MPDRRRRILERAKELSDSFDTLRIAVKAMAHENETLKRERDTLLDYIFNTTGVRITFTRTGDINIEHLED